MMTPLFDHDAASKFRESTSHILGGRCTSQSTGSRSREFGGYVNGEMKFSVLVLRKSPPNECVVFLVTSLFTHKNDSLSNGNVYEFNFLNFYISKTGAVNFAKTGTFFVK